jgi:hypothetical protein
MLEREYPMISEFDADQEAVVRLFHTRYPHAPLPFLGLAGLMNVQYIGYTGHPGTDYAYGRSHFCTQDAWREMELCEQRSRFREGDRDYIIDGLGLPFEKLYFEARRQLFAATNELRRVRSEQYSARRDEIRRFGPPRTRWDSMFVDNLDEFKRFGRTRSIP